MRLGRLASPLGTRQCADPSFPPPGSSVYEVRMHSWVHVPGDVTHMACARSGRSA